MLSIYKITNFLMDIERKREQNRIRQRAYRERKRQAAAAQAAVNVQSAIEQQNVNADIAEEKSNIVAILNRITNLAEARAIDENRRIINRNRQRMYRERKRQAAAAQAAQVEAASEQAVIINILDAITARAVERDVSWNTVTEVADGKIIRLRDSELVVPENHPDAKNADTAKRRSAKLLRTPRWLTKDHLWMIRQAYYMAKLRTKLFGFKWHVDHVVPLKGVSVSGLHVPWNLQVIPATQNIKKSNKVGVI